jgi:hypothetical protein
VHLSDCDGKVHGDLPPGRGVVKFAPYLQAIKELDIDGAVSIELEYSPNPAKIVEWVEEAYRETEPLPDAFQFTRRMNDVGEVDVLTLRHGVVERDADGRLLRWLLLFAHKKALSSQLSALRPTHP